MKIGTISRTLNMTTGTMVSSKKHDHDIGTQLTSIKPNNMQILRSSVTAQEQFAILTQEQTDFIFSEVAKVANKARVPLAVMAAEETGMGCMEDKVIKNSLACELICDRYKNSKTCGLIREDLPHGLRVYANPVGPVCAITPVTNPTSTAISKCLMLAKTRNAGVFLPHPHVSINMSSVESNTSLQTMHLHSNKSYSFIQKSHPRLPNALPKLSVSAAKRARRLAHR
jgi:acyl-CoA reductase-like NAD-dependent aldehyde dehydrogenase